MARRPKLPANVSRFVDRHGKERRRFRKAGCAGGYFKATYGTPEFDAELEAFRAGLPTRVADRVIPRSIGDLVARFYRSARFLKASEQHRRTVRGILEPFRHEFAQYQVAHFRFDHIERVLEARAEKRMVGKRTVGGPGAAENLHEQLKRIFAYAVRLDWIGSNPAEKAELPVKPSRVGFHSWTEDEIAAFQRRHPFGTKARLALELMLWTGVRRSDAVRVGPQHVRGGRIRLTAAKTGKTVDVLAAPDLLRAIEAMPTTGFATLLQTEYGRPFTVNGFGQWFRDRCDEAGLPHCTAHGLRKALARRAADLGATQQQLKAVGQWSSDSDVATYTADAEQRVLADAAVSKVVAWSKLSNLGGEG